MNKRLLFAVASLLMPLFVCSCAAAAVDRGSFRFDLNQDIVQKSIQKHGKLPQNEFEYAVFIPKLQTNHPMRFILALHGVGENHEDYLLKWQVAAAKYHTIVVAPQMKWPVPLTTEYLHYLIDFIDDLSQKYPIDPSRMYVAGASAGGAIGLHLAVDYPERFRGAVIISSIGFDTCLRTGNKLDKIKDYESLPQLLFVHGMKDTVLFETVLNGMEFLLEHGVKAQLYNYDNAGHEHRPEWNKRIFQWIEKVEKSPRNLAIPANS